MMALTHVQLYEALKPAVGEDAARLMAEVVPPAENLATKADLADVLARIDERFARVWEEFAKVRTEMHAESNRTIRWMMGFLISAWVGSFGSLVAILQLR
jgi:hypothetical protein